MGRRTAPPLPSSPHKLVRSHAAPALQPVARGPCLSPGLLQPIPPTFWWPQAPGSTLFTSWGLSGHGAMTGDTMGHRVARDTTIGWCAPAAECATGHSCWGESLGGQSRACGEEGRPCNRPGRTRPGRGLPAPVMAEGFCVVFPHRNKGCPGDRLWMWTHRQMAPCA